MRRAFPTLMMSMVVTSSCGTPFERTEGPAFTLDDSQPVSWFATSILVDGNNHAPRGVGVKRVSIEVEWDAADAEPGTELSAYVTASSRSMDRGFFVRTTAGGARDVTVENPGSCFGTGCNRLNHLIRFEKIGSGTVHGRWVYGYEPSTPDGESADFAVEIAAAGGAR